MLAIVYELLLQSKLTLNVSKTVVITIGNCSVPTNFIIKSIIQIVNRAEQTKNLGIITDFKLTWYQHIKTFIVIIIINHYCP